MKKDKKAFVFDTNFIIENKKLGEVIENLKENFVVYVSQVSIEERISQQYLDIQAKYEDLYKLKEDYKFIATIKASATLEEIEKSLKKGVQKSYCNLFGNKIIPFQKDSDIFNKIWARVLKKIPPFSNEPKASDKGFKDALMWLSILEFFKHSGEEKILFITNDKGFINNKDFLCKEFHEITGKTIDIKENSYYKTLIATEVIEIPEKNIEKLPDVQFLRTQIYNIINAVCYSTDEDSWGREFEVRNFYIIEKIDADYVKQIFENLKEKISTNLFKQSVPATEILSFDYRFINENNISMIALENALKLYEDIKKDLSNYLEQFYSAVADIINFHYIAPPTSDFSEDIPF